MNLKSIILLLMVVLPACGIWQTYRLNDQYGAPDPGRFDEPARARLPGAEVAPSSGQWQRAQAVLESRCAVCHGCYDAPCQLNLTSWEGVTRGASRTPVYDGARLFAGQTSRLFEDALKASEWRAKGFHPVLNEREDAAAPNLEASLMAKMLQLKHRHPGPLDGLLEPGFAIGTEASYQCPTLETFDGYVDAFPEGGMPYGLPALTGEEQAELLAWLRDGAPYEPPGVLAPAVLAAVADWERFFNDDSLKGRLTGRYAYEHLFLANLYFPEASEPAGSSPATPAAVSSGTAMAGAVVGGRGSADAGRVFFRLVRSSTPPGQPVDRIVTRRPYDDPGVDRVYYRLVRDHSTVLAKTHMPYALDSRRLRHWTALFHEAPYSVTELPSYDPQAASNPFVTFAALPQVARYRFMLEEAHYTISGFIKGPVCRGQIALNVINDHFWVAFVDPRFASLAEDAGFLARTRNQLRLPAEDESSAGLLAWRKFAAMEQAFLKEKVAAIDHVAMREALSLGYLWNGDGYNRNASLTIFRHQDSATVVKGLVGEAPQTAWIITYPLLERIHYLLVAGFDVFGNAGHQLSTRLYMDFLRMEGEFNFLALLPAKARPRVRDRWYRGARDDVKDYVYGLHASLAHDTGLRFYSDDPLRELYQKWKRFFGPLQPPGVALSSFGDPLASILQPLDRLVGGPVIQLPETTFLLVDDSPGIAERSPDEGHGGRWFTLLRHRSFSNIAQLFGEEKRHLPEEDSLTVLPGFVGAYPNLFLRVEVGRLPELVGRLQALRDAADFDALVTDFGVRRTNPAFWQVSDLAHRDYRSLQPVEHGLFDYNRLENR